MAGLRSSVVVSITSFLLGILFMHWTADMLTLWKSPVTDENLWAAAAYYKVITHMSGNFVFGLVVVIIAGALTILWSLNDLEAGNIMFDGASIFLYGTAIFVYIRSVLPGLFSGFNTLEIPTKASAEILESMSFPTHLREPTLDIASSHLVCAVALTGVMILQAARWFVQQKDVDVDSDDEEPNTLDVSAESDATSAASKN
jgi:hypothetical protein